MSIIGKVMETVLKNNVQLYEHNGLLTLITLMCTMPRKGSGSQDYGIHRTLGTITTFL